MGPVGVRARTWALRYGVRLRRGGGEKNKGNSIILGIPYITQMSTYHNLMGWDMESWFGKVGHRTDQSFFFLFFTSFPREKVLYTNLFVFLLGVRGSGKGGSDF